MTGPLHDAVAEAMWNRFAQFPQANPGDYVRPVLTAIRSALLEHPEWAEEIGMTECGKNGTAPVFVRLDARRFGSTADRYLVASGVFAFTREADEEETDASK